MSCSIDKTAPSTPSPVTHYTITNHTHLHHQAPLHSHQSQIPPSLITHHPHRSHFILTNHTPPSPITHSTLTDHTVHHHQLYMYTPPSPITLHHHQSHSTLTNHTPLSPIALHPHQSLCFQPNKFTGMALPALRTDFNTLK